jgi:hypothetical protein
MANRGRPSKYKPKFVQDALDYFHNESVSGNYPSIVGLSVLLKVHKDQLYEWEKIHPDFHDALETGRAIGHELLVKRALKDEFNAGFTKFLLINNYGYSSEKTETHNVNEHSFPTGISVNFISSDRS